MAHLDDAVAGVGLAPLFQPIVTLADGSPIGYEALARWTQLGDTGPVAVFSHAAAIGRVDDLDRACIDSAIGHALRSTLPRHTLLSINCEPTSRLLCGSDPLRAAASERFRLLFELTERDLLLHPRRLLDKVADLRADGVAIALDDVGSAPESLALLEVVRPDVVKLDMSVVRSQRPDLQARTVTAVLAHHERTGALILAEGIESDAHVEHALAIGATLGQGFKFGSPAPLGHHATTEPHALPSAPDSTEVVVGSPFALVARHTAVRTARKATLLALSRHLERQAAAARDDTPLVFATVQQHAHLAAETLPTYARLAEVAPLVAVFGAQVPPVPAPGVRGIALAPDDPLVGEWDIVVLGAHLAVALLAREHPGNVGDDAERRFDFVITYDRAIVAAAARNLLDRMD